MTRNMFEIYPRLLKEASGARKEQVEFIDPALVEY
jgi:hypothetical protein